MRGPDTRTLHRPEQRFFADPAIDRLLGTVFALAQEHYVLLDRVRALEEALAKAGSIDASLLGRPRDPAQALAASEQADRFVAALMRPLLGLQESRGLAARPAARPRKRGRPSPG
jgi:hypothetical protein